MITLLIVAGLTSASILVLLACGACVQAGADDDEHGRGDDTDSGMTLRLLADAGVDAYLDERGRLIYRGMHR